ncbi:MAG: tetratricopeptide repeat protein [Caldilineaceae bacterium]|nr:tetratricopeptide repeat protein [Caldilineaceae bacterium]
MTQPFLPTFGPLLRQMRKRAGMTQSDLAAAVGYSISTISSLEKESRRPDVETVAQRFIPALGLQDEPALAARLVEAAALLRREPPPPQITATRRNYLSPLQNNPFHLPTPPTPLVGRDAEVRALCNRLLGHSGRLMTLLGPPGIGKSRLALEIAVRLHSAWRNGAIFVMLAALDDPALLLPTLARAIGLSVEQEKFTAERLVGHLRRKEMLLVLDNFEQIIPARWLVAELLAECPSLRALVTSQERLHLRIEQRVRVQPLAPEAALDLFVQRARTVQENFSPIAEEREVVSAICQRLDYLPLALELSAARMDTLSPQALLAGLSEEPLALLRDGPTHLPPHQRTLTAAIRRSYLLLAPDEQQLFRWLGVFAAFFDGEGVAGLGMDSTGLASLVAHSLLQQERQGEETRYRLLESLRHFAREQLAIAGEALAAHTRYTAWLLALTQRADMAMRTAARPHWLARLDREIENLRGGLAWAVQHQPEMAVALAGTLQEFWYSRGYNDEGQMWLGRALAATSIPSRQRVRALNALGQLLAQQSELDEAEKRLEEAAVLARSLGDQAGLAESLRLTGWVAYDRHERSRTIDLFQESLLLFRAVGDELHAADILTSLAHVDVFNPQADRAGLYTLLEESLAIYRGIGDVPGTIFSLYQKGQLAVGEGAYPAAIACFDEALTLARTLEQKPDIAWGLELLGEAYWLAEELASAGDCWREALHHFRVLGNREAIAITQHHLGQVSRRQGRWDEAAALYSESLVVHQAAGNQYMEARCLVGLGAVALARGEREQAARLLTEAKAMFDSLRPFLAPADATEFATLLASVG